jgi:hypothetical protein
MTIIQEHETIWFPGIYGGRSTEEYTQTAGSIPVEQVVELVQKRADEDGNWVIDNGFVGNNEDKMRKMMEWVSREKNIRQCVEANPDETVDWICRDLANASKWLHGSSGE